MFWPLILPFQITCCVLLVAVVMLTAFASPKAWSRIKTFCLYSALALLAFVPSCTGIMIAVDAFRFGDFSYASYNDISDFRSQRYLPEAATDIQMRRHGNGYFARYKLSSDEFNSYLDNLWQKFGEYSAVERGGFSDEGESVDPESFAMTFGDLGWDCPPEAIVYYSPSEGDGGGATYYVDSNSGLVFQRTGFW
ncbi:hypothetical protein [Adhaeretor mobilis]|uniref:Uncharacterized protein n=1 Tax=Adhaeretor mobilis TaxID=1930276 RepID=A0A517MUW9_9BACT|nr:hypothetical protein [Adhaeretor mobilis]QDS98680.1 hypothetical protein HG15A2_19610 [Adhaeretor mobilis]